MTYATGDNDDIAELFAEDPEMRDNRKPRLCRFVYEGARLQYKYDFGDCWEHDIQVEKKLVSAWEPYGEAYILEGAQACPTEDAGGPRGYEDREIRLFLLSQIKNADFRGNRTTRRQVAS